MQDNVNHPRTLHLRPVRPCSLPHHRDFNIGNAIKYLWRAGLKGEADKTQTEKTVEDLRKAIWYIQDEIKMLTNTK